MGGRFIFGHKNHNTNTTKAAKKNLVLWADVIETSTTLFVYFFLASSGVPPCLFPVVKQNTTFLTILPQLYLLAFFEFLSQCLGGGRPLYLNEISRALGGGALYLGGRFTIFSFRFIIYFFHERTRFPVFEDFLERLRLWLIYSPLCLVPRF